METQNSEICTTINTVALDANVQQVVNAIKTNSIIPYGDYGGHNIYYFSTMDNGLGNIVYTVFDRSTHLGLASFMVRYGAASTIRQIILGTHPRSQINIRHLILPAVPVFNQTNGSVTP